MRTNGLFTAAASALALLGALAGASLSGCSIQNTPHAPTFNTDIRPIMLSRCVRCHGAGGTLNADPTSTVTAYRFPPRDGHFDRFEDDCPDAMSSGCHGLGFYTIDPGKSTLVNYIHNTGGLPSPMPPAPAPRLTSDQLDIIDLWLATGAPVD